MPVGKNTFVPTVDSTGQHRRGARRRSLALAYHAVTDDWDDPLAVRVDRFRKQVAHLHETGYRGVRFTDLALQPDRGDAVAITFDDAFSSVITQALPLLEELGWPATVFASSGAIDPGAPMVWLLGQRGTRPPDSTTLMPLSWSDLRLLHERGWEVGSHGTTHRRLSTLDAEERTRELTTARSRIEAEVAPCTAISYPWGEVVDHVVDAAAMAGYTAGGGLEGRFEQHDPLRVPRFAVSRRDGSLRFAAKASRTLSAVRRTALWTGLERVRRRDYEPASDASRSMGPPR